MPREASSYLALAVMLLIHQAAMVVFFAAGIATLPLAVILFILGGHDTALKQMGNTSKHLKNCVFNFFHPFKMSEGQIMRLALRQRRRRLPRR